jgi:hypothetical protein
MSQGTAAKSRHSLRVVSASVPHAFSVRFDSTPGSVRIEEQGVQISSRRLTLLGFRQAEQFIHRSEILQVYREGDAIRIDLQGEARRPFVRFCAEDAARAAEIVKLLPTTRTIELEASAERPHEGEKHRSLWWLALLVIPAVLLTRSWIPTPHPQQPIVVQAAAVKHPASIAYAPSLQARGDLQKFIPRIQSLADQFAVALDAVQRGNISQQDFRAGLEKWLLPQWESLTSQLPPTPVTDPVRADADAQIYSVIVTWRLVLSTYAQGLHDNDYRVVLKAFDYLRDAEAREREAVALLDRLEGAQPTGQ